MDKAKNCDSYGNASRLTTLVPSLNIPENKNLLKMISIRIISKCLEQ
jgi:hypothetical protein